MFSMVPDTGSIKEWYVWTIKSGKFEVVSRYIDKYLPQIKEVLYPTVTTEWHTPKGQPKKRQVPMYTGYLFLQYEHDKDNPQVWIKLNAHPFVTRYVGPCTESDLVSVSSMKKVKKLNLEEVKDFRIDDKVVVNGGVFKDFEGSVIGISSNSIRVQILNSGKTMKAVFSPDDLNILDRLE